VTYLRLAATVCARRYTPNEATATLQHALELAAKLPETSRGRAETEILETLAGMYLVTFDGRTVDVYRSLQVRAAQYGLTGMEVRALVGVAYPLSWSSAHEAFDVIERALHLSADERDPLTRARARAGCLVRRAGSAAGTPMTRTNVARRSLRFAAAEMTSSLLCTSSSARSSTSLRQHAERRDRKSSGPCHSRPRAGAKRGSLLNTASSSARPSSDLPRLCSSSPSWMRPSR
jgi:hypothetical protein